MKKIVAIGELLIDFTPTEQGNGTFQKNAGGAPANVAAAAAISGGHSLLISQVGMDHFGTFLIQTLKEAGVETKYIEQTEDGQTSLAFVTINKDGQRDFSFYRSNAADLLYNANQLPLETLEENDIIHFCSVNLVDSPMKKAHKVLIEEALKKNCIISFDPNVRLPLWDDATRCRETILEFLPYAHIVKISDEELPFITEVDDVEEAIQTLFVGNVKVILYTCGANGAHFYTKSQHAVVEGIAVQAIDTTGAGDAFIGAFLSKMLQDDLSSIVFGDFCEEDVLALLTYANKFASCTTKFTGAIPSYLACNS